MQKWHFRFSGRVNVEGMEDKIMNLYPENIPLAIRISDYYNENMARMMLKLRIDKALFDIIAQNAKTATISLRIEKFDKQDDDGIERNYLTYLEDEFSIFVADDINYNKDIDYPDLDKIAEDKTRQDVYKEVSIGLISKSCIEANKTLANAVFYKTTMINMVAYYMQELHALIEPFTYNDELQQLIIPPQETLVKTIEFLNNVKVFYDTNYLFFIDEPVCTYLISKSGQGIEKKDDVFLDVYFNIHKKSDSAAVVLGMGQDNQNKRYHIDINVADTRYTIDHDTAKIYTDIQQIINPDKTNTVSALSSVVEAAKGIKKTVDTIKTTSQSLKKQFAKLPNDLFKQKVAFKAHVKDYIQFGLFATGILSEYGEEGNVLQSNAQDKMKEAYDLINTVPAVLTVTSSSGGGGGSSGSTVSSYVYVFGNSNASSTENKKKILDTIYQNITADFSEDENKKAGYPRIYYTYKEVDALNNLFIDVNNSSARVGYDAGMISNNLSCYTEINVQDGVTSTSKKINKLDSDAAQVLLDTQNKIVANQHFVDELQAHYAAALHAVETAMEYIKNASSSSSGGTPSVDLNEVYTKLDILYRGAKDEHGNDIGGDLLSISNTLNNSTISIKNIIGNFSSTTSTMQNLAAAINSKAGQNLISAYTTNLKSTVKGIKSNLTAIGKSVDETMKKIQDLGKLGGSLKDLSFGLGDLTNLAKSIDAIGDLTGIGRLGKSTFKTALLLGQIDGTVKSAVKIFNTKNDNSNKIKGIKAEMENRINQLALNKFDLDPSVFTPNKRYSIKNFDGHSDKNGLFLLNKKTEIYVREDDTCSCNVILEFAKVASDTDKNNTSSTLEQDAVNNNLGLGISAKVSNTGKTKFDISLTTASKNKSDVQNFTSSVNQLIKQTKLGDYITVNSKDPRPRKVLGSTSIYDTVMHYK